MDGQDAEGEEPLPPNSASQWDMRSIIPPVVETIKSEACHHPPRHARVGQGHCIEPAVHDPQPSSSSGERGGSHELASEACMQTPNSKTHRGTGRGEGDPSDPSIGSEIKGKPVRLNLPPSSCTPRMGAQAEAGRASSSP